MIRTSGRGDGLRQVLGNRPMGDEAVCADGVGLNRECVSWGGLAATVVVPGVVFAQADGGSQFTIGDPTVGAAPIPAAGGDAGGAAQAPGGSFGGIMPLLLLGVFVFFIFTMISSERKQKKKRNEMMGALKRNDRVQTVGGIIGVVTEIKDEEVVLRVDEASKTKIRFSKTAVQQVLKSSPIGDAEVKPSDVAEPEPAGV